MIDPKYYGNPNMYELSQLDDISLDDLPTGDRGGVDPTWWEQNKDRLKNPSGFLGPINQFTNRFTGDVNEYGIPMPKMYNPFGQGLSWGATAARYGVPLPIAGLAGVAGVGITAAMNAARQNKYDKRTRSAEIMAEKEAAWRQAEMMPVEQSKYYGRSKMPYATNTGTAMDPFADYDPKMKSIYDDKFQEPIGVFGKYGGMVPKYQFGGMTQGPSHEQGGIPMKIKGGGMAELEGGEMIVSKAALKMNPQLIPFLNRINQEAKHKKIHGHGYGFGNIAKGEGPVGVGLNYQLNDRTNIGVDYHTQMHGRKPHHNTGKIGITRKFADGGPVKPLAQRWNDLSAEEQDMFINHIRSNEGYRLDVYPDPVKGKDFPTVGIGHLLTADEKKQWPIGTKLSDAQIMELARKDIGDAYDRSYSNYFAPMQKSGKYPNLVWNIENAKALTDANFNLGDYSTKFPKGGKALIDGNPHEAFMQTTYRDPKPGNPGAYTDYYKQVPSRYEQFTNWVKGLEESQGAGIDPRQLNLMGDVNIPTRDINSIPSPELSHEESMEIAKEKALQKYQGKGGVSPDYYLNRKYGGMIPNYKYGGRVQKYDDGGMINRPTPEMIYRYLIDTYKISPEHAAGMVANIKAESDFNPAVIEEGKTIDDGGIGLFQYTYKDRKDKFLESVPNWRSDWQGQIDFAMSEGITKKYLAQDFKNAEEATKDFMVNWENPKDQSDDAIKGRQIGLKQLGYDPKIGFTMDPNVSAANDKFTRHSADHDIPKWERDFEKRWGVNPKQFKKGSLNYENLDKYNVNYVNDLVKVGQNIADKAEKNNKKLTEKDLLELYRDLQFGAQNNIDYYKEAAMNPKDRAVLWAGIVEMSNQKGLIDKNTYNSLKNRKPGTYEDVVSDLDGMGVARRNWQPEFKESVDVPSYEFTDQYDPSDPYTFDEKYIEDIDAEREAMSEEDIYDVSEFMPEDDEPIVEEEEGEEEKTVKTDPGVQFDYQGRPISGGEILGAAQTGLGIGGGFRQLTPPPGTPQHDAYLQQLKVAAAEGFDPIVYQNLEDQIQGRDRYGAMYHRQARPQNIGLAGEGLRRAQTAKAMNELSSKDEMFKAQKLQQLAPEIARAEQYDWRNYMLGRQEEQDWRNYWQQSLKAGLGNIMEGGQTRKYMDFLDRYVGNRYVEGIGNIWWDAKSNSWMKKGQNNTNVPLSEEEQKKVAAKASASNTSGESSVGNTAGRMRSRVFELVDMFRSLPDDKKKELYNNLNEEDKERLSVGLKQTQDTSRPSGDYTSGNVGGGSGLNEEDPESYIDYILTEPGNNTNAGHGVNFKNYYVPMGSEDPYTGTKKKMSFKDIYNMLDINPNIKYNAQGNIIPSSK